MRTRSGVPHGKIALVIEPIVRAMDARRKDRARMILRCDYCKKLLPQETVDLLVKEIGAENELITRTFSEHSDRLLAEAHAKTHALAAENIKLRAGIEAMMSARIEAANRAQIARLSSRL